MTERQRAQRDAYEERLHTRQYGRKKPCFDPPPLESLIRRAAILRQRENPSSGERAELLQLDVLIEQRRREKRA